MKQGKIIDNYRYFESQQDDEKVIFVVRRHWIILLKPFLVGTVIIAVSVAFSLLSQGLEAQFFNKIGSTVLTVVMSLIVLFVVLYVYLSWLINYLNLIILTNEHIVEIEQSALFARKVSELNLDCLEDATFIQKGFWKTILHYGDILVQTAGSLPNFDFKGVPYPYETAQKIMEIQDEFRKNNTGNDSGMNQPKSEQPMSNVQQIAQGQNVAGTQDQSQTNAKNNPEVPGGYI